jgi:hypothetical protein
MFLKLAHFVLGLHIIKKSVRLRTVARLRYFLLARRVYGALIPFFCFAALSGLFIAICCIYPHFAVIIHLDKPADEAIPCVRDFLVFCLLSTFSAMMVPILILGRRLLANYWLLFFLAEYIPIKPTPAAATN